MHDLVMLGSLLERVRELYGQPYTLAQQAAFHVAVQAIRTMRRATPNSLARGWNTRPFERVARTERWRIEHGKPTPQVPHNLLAASASPDPVPAAAAAEPGTTLG